MNAPVVQYGDFISLIKALLDYPAWAELHDQAWAELDDAQALRELARRRWLAARPGGMGRATAQFGVRWARG